MKKIIVIGCPGSGKSTFSRELHKRTNIPLYHLDMQILELLEKFQDKNVITFTSREEMNEYLKA